MRGKKEIYSILDLAQNNHVWCSVFFFPQNQEKRRGLMCLFLKKSRCYSKTCCCISVDSVSVDFDFGFENLIAPPHQRRTSISPPLAGLGSVSQSHQQCGYIDVGRSCRLRYRFAHS